jgi:hypothetical protein
MIYSTVKYVVIKARFNCIYFHNVLFKWDPVGVVADHPDGVYLIDKIGGAAQWPLHFPTKWHFLNRHSRHLYFQP